VVGNSIVEVGLRNMKATRRKSEMQEARSNDLKTSNVLKGNILDFDEEVRQDFEEANCIDTSEVTEPGVVLLDM
jgi:hypothetical protein